MIDALAVQAAVMPATRTLSQPARRRCRGCQHVVVCAAAVVRGGTIVLCAPSQNAGCLRTGGVRGMQRDERMAMMKVPAPHVPAGIGISISIQTELHRYTLCIDDWRRVAMAGGAGDLRVRRLMFACLLLTGMPTRIVCHPAAAGWPETGGQTHGRFFSPARHSPVGPPDPARVARWLLCRRYPVDRSTAFPSAYATTGAGQPLPSRRWRVAAAAACGACRPAGR